MSNQQSRTNDRNLAALFQNLDTPLPDDGFTELVVRRVGRRMWWRRAILVSVAVIGGAFAFLPLLYFSVGLSGVLMDLALHWNDPRWLNEYKEVLLAALVALAVPFSMRLLD